MPLHDLNATLINLDAYEDASHKTEIINGLDLADTFFLPLPKIREQLPVWSWANATGELTVVNHEKPIPAPQHRKRRFAPWGQVVREVTRDRKMPMFVVVMAAVGIALGTAAAGLPQNTGTQKPQVVVKSPGAKHRRPETPSPSPSAPRIVRTPHRPSQAPVPVPVKTRTPSPAPQETQTAVPEPVPTPKPTPKPSPSHTHTPKPDPKPTHTQEPSPDPTITEPTPEEPTRQPVTEVPAPTPVERAPETPASSPPDQEAD